nr:chloroplast envelope membrane protein [Tanacetum cinerariifolium]
MNRLKDDDLLDAEEETWDSGGGLSSDDEGLNEGVKFEAWKRRAEAIVELREAQANVQNEEQRKWKDWLLDGTNGGSNGSSWIWCLEERRMRYCMRIVCFTFHHLIRPSYLKMQIYNAVHLFRLKDDDLLDAKQEIGDSGGGGLSSDDERLSEGKRFEAWKRRAEAIVELTKAQENVQNEEQMKWEDWLIDGMNSDSNGSSWYQEPRDNVVDDFIDFILGRELVESVKAMVFGREDDEILYENSVFRFASFN